MTIANNIPRRDFLLKLGMVSISMMLTKSQVFGLPASLTNPLIDFKDSLNDEDIFTYISRVSGGFDLKLYKQLVGTANEFKEGDGIAGIAAPDETARKMARNLIANTLLSDVIEQPLFRDEQYDLIHNTTAFDKDVIGMTLGQLKEFLLKSDEADIKRIMPSLSTYVQRKPLQRSINEGRTSSADASRLVSHPSTTTLPAFESSATITRSLPTVSTMFKKFD
jgi:ethanolamine ammonia-lyase large subunit